MSETATRKGFTEAQKQAMKQYKKRFIDRLNALDMVSTLNLPRARKQGYICPLCGSGKGENGTGAVIQRSKAGKQLLTCYSKKCFYKSDILDALQRMNPGATQDQILKEYFPEFDITIPLKELSHGKRDSAPEVSSTMQDKEETAKEALASRSEGAATIDHRSYYKQCAAFLKDSKEAQDYLAGRGITMQTARRFNIGFDPIADPAQSGHPCSRIIIPTTKEHYIARSIDPQTPKAYTKLNPKGARPGIFNIGALYGDAEAVFVVEGAFDAMSIAEAGFDAVAINSTSNVNMLIEILQEKPTKATLIACLDNDAAGQKANAELISGLKMLNVSCITAKITGAYKDANEYLQREPEAFREAVETAADKIIKPDNIAEYINGDSLANEIKLFADSNNLRTGFRNLDEKAGGIYTGLYVLAAISSLGKTSFALQIADSIAASGTDVLYFSLEQSRLELVTKSIARTLAQRDPERAVNSLSIRKGNLSDAVIDAAEEYAAAVGSRLNIIECGFSYTVKDIISYCLRYKSRNKVTPCVFVDYLQVLQAPEDANRQQKREAIDHAVTDLKDLSKMIKAPVFVISSVNRSNYLMPIDFESLKESGGIEYSADVIWGLQLQCLNEPIFAEANKIKEKRELISAAKAETPRKIELKCLKNRYGVATFSCNFNYYPARDLFTVSDAPQAGGAYTGTQQRAGRSLRDFKAGK